jgi:hypothetical protein
MQAADGPRVVIRRHMLLQAARNQCMAGSINAGALKLYFETLTLNNDGSNHANTPSRTNQPPRTACACMRESRRAGIAIPLQCLPGMEWTAGERAQHRRGDAARGGGRRDDPAGDPGPGRSRSDDRDGRVDRRSFRRAAVTEGRGTGSSARKNADPADVVAVQRDMKPGTNALLCNQTGRRFMVFRVLSLPLCPSPFRAT